MDERKLELKRLKKSSNAVRREHTALWSWLSILSLVLALTTTLASVCCIFFGGALGAYYGGKLWEPDNADQDAVYFALEHKTPEERQAAMDALQYKAVTEGAVLLKNSGVLPLSAEINVDILSVGSEGVTYGDALVVCVNTPEACKELNINDGEKPVVLIVNTPALPQPDFLENVDACLWTGGTADGNAVADLLTGKAAPTGALAVTGGSADYQLCERQYVAFVAGEAESYDYKKDVVLPFGYGLSYTTFAYSNMALSYDVTADTFTATVTVTNTGDRAGREIIQLYAQTPDAVKLIGFAKTEALEPGSAQTITMTAERYALASYDASGEGGYVLTAGDYYFTVAADAHTAANQILATRGFTPENTEGRMDAVGAPGMTGIYIQTETDTQSYRLSVSGAEVKNRFGQENAENPAEMPVTGANNGLKLQDLRGLAFDDPLWESLLDQMNHWEMAVLANVSFGRNMHYTPETTLPENLLANAFDTELAYLAGKQEAQMCLAAERYCLVTEGIHTDDSFLASTLFATWVQGVREKGVLASVQAEDMSGLAEQTVRERVLEPYRLALQQGNGVLVADPACFDLLKTEWGYTGVLLEKDKMDVSITQIAADAFAGREDPVAASALRERSHRSLYALVNSAAMNGVGEDTELRAPRLTWYYGIYIAAGILWILHIVMGAKYSAGRRKWKDSPEYRKYSTMRLVLKTEKEKTAL